jgi:uncharacterized protein (DUF697 family)
MNLQSLISTAIAAVIAFGLTYALGKTLFAIWQLFTSTL